MQKQVSTAALSAPSVGLLLTEPVRALFDFCAARFTASPTRQGDGHPVVVYPGLGGGALSTSVLRNFLRDSGFAPEDWGGGLNTGPEGDFDAWLELHAQRVRALHARTGRKVSLVGWSLGGVYAREIAKLCPGAVRQVVTMGTPFGAMHDANHARTIYRALGGDTSQLTPELQQRLRECPAVPTTSIYSRSDGIVSWQGCLQECGAQAQNVEVNASHLGMGTHSDVLRIVADRLAQREGQWKPYAPRTLKRAIAPRRSTRSRAR